MSIIHAFILGIVQGLTEFLPISSSGHLNIFPWLFNWEKIPDSFDVALHIGTLLALGIFFFKDWIALIVGGYKAAIKKEKSTEGKIFWYLVAGTIPAGILSLVLDKISEGIIGEDTQKEMLFIAIALMVMGVLLYVVDKMAKSKVKYEDITLKQSIIIAMSQAIAAAFPGVSRSGITMTVARMLKIDRESAAKYSFMLAAPITLAAALAKVKDFTFDAPFFVGVFTSFVVGMLCIKFLMKYLKKGTFKGFAIYRVLFGLLILVLLIIR